METIESSSRTEARWGTCKSSQEAGDLPRGCGAPASLLLLLIGHIYLVMREQPWLTSRTTSVYLWDSLTSPIKQNHPVMFTILLSAEEIRIRSTFIYVAVGIAAHSSLTAFFYGHMGDGSRGGFHTNTQLVSPRRAVIFSAALLMKQTDLHSAKCITRTLITVHYSVSCLTFIQSSVETWGPFGRRNEAVCLYAECSKRRSRVQDNRFLFFFHPNDKARCFLTQNIKQAG